MPHSARFVQVAPSSSHSKPTSVTPLHTSLCEITEHVPCAPSAKESEQNGPGATSGAITVSSPTPHTHVPRAAAWISNCKLPREWSSLPVNASQITSSSKPCCSAWPMAKSISVKSLRVSYSNTHGCCGTTPSESKSPNTASGTMPRSCNTANPPSTAYTASNSCVCRM